jgi:hypothetical protein
LRVAPPSRNRGTTISSRQSCPNACFPVRRAACFPVPTWPCPGPGAQQRGWEARSHPQPRAAQRAWRGWRAPDLPRREHQGTLVASCDGKAPSLSRSDAVSLFLLVNGSCVDTAGGLGRIRRSVPPRPSHSASWWKADDRTPFVRADPHLVACTVRPGVDGARAMADLVVRWWSRGLQIDCPPAPARRPRRKRCHDHVRRMFQNVGKPCRMPVRSAR